MPPANTSGQKKAAPPRRGRGQPKFEPSDEQRNLVKLLVAENMPQERICTAILNRHTNRPIDVKTFVKAFAREIEIAALEIDSVLSSTLVQQAKKGSLGHLIWYEKTRRGRRDPSDEPKITTKIDPSGNTVRHEVEIVGGLPKGSTAEKPEGEGYSDIPPEESHG